VTRSHSFSMTVGDLRQHIWPLAVHQSWAEFNFMQMHSYMMSSSNVSGQYATIVYCSRARIHINKQTVQRHANNTNLTT